MRAWVGGALDTDLLDDERGVVSHEADQRRAASAGCACPGSTGRGPGSRRADGSARHARRRPRSHRSTSSQSGNRLPTRPPPPARGRSHGPALRVASALIALANGFTIERLADPEAAPDELFVHAIVATLRGFSR